MAMLFCVLLSCRSLKTEVQGERYKAKGEKETEIHTEKKSKPVRSFSFWWIAGGTAVVLLALLGVWKKVN